MTVEFRYRCDFNGRAREEGFVGALKVVELYLSDLSSNAQALCQAKYRISGDPGKDGTLFVVGKELAIARHKQIFARTFGNRGVGVQEQGLVESAGARVFGREDGVQVLAACFGGRRNCIGRKLAPS